MKYFCEFCGKKFHNAVAASMCSNTAICRTLGFPPKGVVGTYRIRGCAITLAKTAAELMQQSPAGKINKDVFDMGQKIIDWAVRIEDALTTNTPMTLGKRMRLHNGLVEFVWGNVWKRKEPLPNLHALELAHMYATDAKIYVSDMIEKNEHGRFWFIDEHPEFLLHESINMPLAIYITEMKKRRLTSKMLDEAIMSWSTRDRVEMENVSTPELVNEMLRHCWRDELRSWNFMLAAIEKAMKWIKANGTAVSLDLSRHNAEEKYQILMDYIWDEEFKTKKVVPMKLWLVDRRFWVVAEKRADAKEVLLKETGLTGKQVEGIAQGKKLYDENGLVAETAGEILAKVKKPSVYGVEK